MDDWENDNFAEIKLAIIMDGVVLIGLLLSLYVLFETYRLKKSGLYDAYQQKRLQFLSQITTLIFLIETIYLVIQAYLDYENKKNDAHRSLLFASILALLAKSIFYYWSVKHDDEDIIELLY